MRPGQAGGDGDAVTDAATAPATHEVVLVTYPSFTLPEELIVEFETESGWDLTVQTAGDAGELTNRPLSQRGIEPPSTLADLTEAPYADLFVTPGADDLQPGAGVS